MEQKNYTCLYFIILMAHTKENILSRLTQNLM